MLRPRMLGPRLVSRALVLWGAAWLALPSGLDAAPLPPEPAGTAAAGAIPALEARLARAELEALGLAPRDVDALLARLSADERAELVARAAELGVGGHVAVLALLLVIALLLYLPMAGRTAGWWP